MEFNIENQENILLNDLFKAISDILNSSKKTNEKQKRIYPESSEGNFFRFWFVFWKNREFQKLLLSFTDL